jgi:hypothetical protein
MPSRDKTEGYCVVHLCYLEGKNFTVSKGMHHEFWIAKLKTNEVSTRTQLVEFGELWSKVNEVHLADGTADDITWKSINSGV